MGQWGGYPAGYGYGYGYGYGDYSRGGPYSPSSSYPYGGLPGFGQGQNRYGPMMYGYGYYGSQAAPPGYLPMMPMPQQVYPFPSVLPDWQNGKVPNGRNIKQNGSSSTGGSQPKSSEPAGKDLIEEAQAAQDEMRSDSKSEGGGSGAAKSEGMKAVGILMQVAGVVMSMDMIAMALQVTGFILNTVGMALETAGTAMDASGMALIASGQALLSNPFTAAAGAAMIASGTALKVTGNTMKVTGKVMKVTGKIMEKTAKALQKALKVLMRGAKNVARNALNKMRALKRSGADKMMRARQAKAAKLSEKGKPEKAAKMEKKAEHWKSVSEKTKANMDKTSETMARSTAKNQAAKQELKADVRGSLQQGKNAMKAAPAQAKSSAQRQWKEMGLFKGSNYGPKNGVKGSVNQSKQRFKDTWKAGTTRTNGGNRFSASKTEMKTEWGKLKTDFKGQFRTTKGAKSSEKPKSGSKDDLALTSKANPKEPVTPPARPTADNLKLDSTVEGKLKSLEAGKTKIDTPTKAGRSKDDRALPRGPRSKEPVTPPARPTADNLKLDSTVEGKLGQMKPPTRFDTGKAVRWTGSAAMIGVGAGITADANRGNGADYDPLMRHDRFNTWEEWHQYYDPLMEKASGRDYSYQSGYYDESLLPDYYQDPFLPTYPTREDSDPRRGPNSMTSNTLSNLETNA